MAGRYWAVNSAQTKNSKKVAARPEKYFIIKNMVTNKNTIFKD
ncbi:hypothetical protein FIC_00214 [Flavobacteriaceae bacterium 3519-10]|nr:hypothetical protein FIC_00214 [Flavobacteriaceae bacterium 3519-10]